MAGGGWLAGSRGGLRRAWPRRSAPAHLTRPSAAFRGRKRLLPLAGMYGSTHMVLCALVMAYSSAADGTAAGSDTCGSGDEAACLATEQKQSDMQPPPETREDCAGLTPKQCAQAEAKLRPLIEEAKQTAPRTSRAGQLLQEQLAPEPKVQYRPRPTKPHLRPSKPTPRSYRSHPRPIDPVLQPDRYAWQQFREKVESGQVAQVITGIFHAAHLWALTVSFIAGTRKPSTKARDHEGRMATHARCCCA